MAGQLSSQYRDRSSFRDSAECRDRVGFRGNFRSAPSTTESRVEQNTCPRTNAMIRRRIEANVLHFARRPQEIDRRLWELDREWDIERMLEANAALITVSGFVFGKVFRKLAWLPLIAQGFMLQHAVQGWCPPLPIMRQLGVRTTREINHERYALKMLRGDFGPRLEADPEGAARLALWAADPEHPSRR